MTSHRFTLAGAALEALPEGALWAPDARLLCVSDLHLGKAERIARREGRLTPPYETIETLGRLRALVDRLRPATVVCLGDSFDDGHAAAAMDGPTRGEIAAMAAGRRWVWIAGNHDPAPLGFGGEHRRELAAAGLVFRHIAEAGAEGEVSGHYHPKARLRGRGRPAFVIDCRRAVMPAFGLYTGGLDVVDPAFDGLMGPEAVALLTGRRIVAAPRAGLVAASDRRRDAPERAGVRAPI